MRRRLFVDDNREFPGMGYECVRSAEDAIFLLRIMKFDHISLDYNLGKGCKGGLDILIWMKANNVFVPEINIHSNHIFGRERMREYCEENFPDSKITMRTLPK